MFRQVSVQSGYVTVANCSQAWTSRQQGSVVAQSTSLVTGEVLSTNLIVYTSLSSAPVCSGCGSLFVVNPVSQTEATFDLATQAILRSSKTTYTFDAYSNPSFARVVTSGGTGLQQTTEVVTSFGNIVSPSLWQLGLMYERNATTMASGAGSAPPITRSQSWSYDAVGMVATEVTEPFDLTTTSTRTFVRDPFGNVINVTLSGFGIPRPRSTTTSFDPSGRFVVSVTNSLGYAEYTVRSVDPRFGAPLSVADSNGLVTTFGYDAFGQLISTQEADSSSETIDREWCPSPSPTCVFTITTDDSCGTFKNKSMDLRGRVTRTQSFGFNGNPVNVDTVYNSAGLVSKQSPPYYVADGPMWTTHAYDAIQRPTLTIFADGSWESMLYTATNITHTNRLGQVTVQFTDTFGRIISVVDSGAPGGTVQYGYDSMGRITQLQDPGGFYSNRVYNKLGQVIEFSDSNLGTLVMAYDATGALLSTTDGSGRVVQRSYDDIGRLLVESAADGSFRKFQYDAPDALGLMTSMSSNSHSQSFSYDNFGRPISTTHTVQGMDYSFKVAYDTQSSCSRVAQRTNEMGWSQILEYDNWGMLLSERDAGHGSAAYWTVTDVNAHGDILSQTFGNGLVNTQIWDPVIHQLVGVNTTSGDNDLDFIQALSYSYDRVGNVLSRTDRASSGASLVEAFTYDSLNRMTSALLTKGNVPENVISVQYDFNGNIMYKSDMGRYEYSTAGPHAVTTIEGGPAAAMSYQYDRSGRMVSGGGRSFTYDGFGQPQSVTQGNFSSSFMYSATGALICRTDVDPVAGTTTVLMLGSFEQVQQDGSPVLCRTRLHGGTVILANGCNGQTPSATYISRDRVGSPHVVTDSTGAVQSRYSYDAFGQSRNATTWLPFTDLDPLSGDDLIVDVEGFAAEMQFEDLGLVFLGARLYDPAIGRVASADLTVRYATFSQDLNRYSYVVNNPMALTDPSGMSFLTKIWHGCHRALRDVGRYIKHHAISLLHTITDVALVGLNFIPGCEGWCEALATTAVDMAFVKLEGGSVSKMLKTGAMDLATSAAGAAFEALPDKGALVEVGEEDGLKGLKKALPTLKSRLSSKKFWTAVGKEAENKVKDMVKGELKEEAARVVGEVAHKAAQMVSDTFGSHSVTTTAKSVPGASWYNANAASFEMSFDGSTSPPEDTGLPKYTGSSVTTWTSTTGTTLDGGDELGESDHRLMQRYGLTEDHSETPHGNTLAYTQPCLQQASAGLSPPTIDA